MSFFQTIRRGMMILGFTPNQALQTHPFNGRIAVGFMIQCLSLALQLVYSFRGGHNFMEYSQLIYIISAVGVVFIVFIISSFQMKAIFKIIIKFEKLLDGKKLQIFYKKYLTTIISDQNIESHISRNERFRIIRKNQWAHWKMLLCNISDCGNCDTDICGTANNSCMLFHLFYHGFWKRCICAPIHNMVKYFFFFIYFSETNDR